MKRWTWESYINPLIERGMEIGDTAKLKFAFHANDEYISHLEKERDELRARLFELGECKFLIEQIKQVLQKYESGEENDG